jgi:ubiquinone/menaquinone biosynthesis C-methylase UbiE
MYKDSRPLQSDSVTASTPDMWAQTFAASTRMNAWRTLRFSRTKEWALIRRHVPARGAVLDAGCGFGEWVCFLGQQGYRAEGLDFSSDLISRLRATYPQLTWQNGDVRRMPYPDDTFDTVISWGVIEHDEAGPAEALSEFMRVLKPGGIVIVTVPLDSAAQRRAADYLYRGGALPQVFFQYFMTAEELSSHVTAAGFGLIEQGVLPNAVLQLVSPRLAARLKGLSFRLANLWVSTFLSWLPRYCVMRYCVATKPRLAHKGGL